MQIGLSTLEDECASQGLDWEEVLEQLAREKAKITELGLTINDVNSILNTNLKKKRTMMRIWNRITGDPWAITGNSLDTQF
jgi:capsid protein